MLCHPPCAGQVGVERAPGTIVLELRINVEHKLRHLVPIGSLGNRIEHPQIRHKVLLVVHRQDRLRWCDIGDAGIERRFFHERVI